MMRNPPISVLMTTRNGAHVIRESLDSILAQRFVDFELMIVDDASEDATPALLAAYAAGDRRIRVMRAERNLGVVGARNLGFAACRGAYVAMLDHDDVSHPDRLAMQGEFLDINRDVVLVGTEVILATENRARITDHRGAPSPTLLRWQLHVDNPLTWSSVMLRTAAVHRLGHFLRPEFEYADDFDLYHRLLSVGDIARLDSVLTTYRWHAANTTHSHSATIAANAVKVLSAAYHRWLGDQAEPAARLVIQHLSDRKPPRDLQTVQRLGEVIENILVGFCETYAVSPAERATVEAAASGLWLRLVRSAVRAGLPEAAHVHRTRPALCQSASWTAADLLGSLAIGAVRRGYALWPFPELPHRGQ